MRQIHRKTVPAFAAKKLNAAFVRLTETFAKEAAGSLARRSALIDNLLRQAIEQSIR